MGGRAGFTIARLVRFHLTDLDALAKIRRSMTLMHLLRDRAAEKPGGAEFIFLPDGETQLPPLTARRLDESARAIAARLQSRWPAGTRVLLLYPSGLEFHAAFFGCIYGGMIPVP